MSRWRVTFEVDLTGLIPKQEDLKPHDYPLPAWASQTIFEMLFNHGTCAALESQLRYEAKEKDPEVKRAMLAHYERIRALCEEAGRTAKVEEVK